MLHQQQLMQQQQQLMQQQKAQMAQKGKYGNAQAQLQLQQQQQMRRRKKYRTSNQVVAGQAGHQQQMAQKRQQGDQVMKAYGVPKAINGAVQQSQGGSYSHPNRQYVKRANQPISGSLYSTGKRTANKRADLLEPCMFK